MDAARAAQVGHDAILAEGDLQALEARVEQLQTSAEAGYRAVGRRLEFRQVFEPDELSEVQVERGAQMGCACRPLVASKLGLVGQYSVYFGGLYPAIVPVGPELDPFGRAHKVGILNAL